MVLHIKKSGGRVRVGKWGGVRRETSVVSMATGKQNQVILWKEGEWCSSLRKKKKKQKGWTMEARSRPTANMLSLPIMLGEL